MAKNYGPKGFEKAWAKALRGFNETKIFFAHEGSETIVKYIDEDQLRGVKMYRAEYALEYWVNHFQYYLDTGVFDSNAYWVEYTSKRNDDNTLDHVYAPKVHRVPMVLKDKVWSVHSPEFNKFMKDEREAKGDIGFKQVARPEGEK